MKRWIFFVVLLSVLSAHARTNGQPKSISGRIRFEGKVTGDVIVRLYPVAVSPGGQIRPLTKRDVYGAAEPIQTSTLEKPRRYAFESLPLGHYSVLAFIDADGNGEPSFLPPEPLGWYTSHPGGWFAPIDLTNSSVSDADFTLRIPTPFSQEDKHTDHGALRWIQGLPVLQLWGTAEERGFAHGYLAGEQIIDFLEFYIVEDSWRSAQRYQDIFVAFIENHVSAPPEFLRECDAVIEGMRSSKTDMYIQWLERDFNRTDLLAINAYIERRAAFALEPASSCTQFAFWGTQTGGSELNGGLIAARNMDGECDIRKVTVSHFLLYAVAPSEPGHKRWFSAMWPGFVGTISGINEDGLYSMENAGGSGPGPVPDGIVPCSRIQRTILETQGREASPESVLKTMETFTCSEGGITAAGSIILWAVPYSGQDTPAFVYEGGRGGGAMRSPVDVRPADPINIMASNHHLVYGFDADRPDHSLGRRVSFSSRWRYEVGMNTLEAWSRQNKPLGIAEAKKLLQMVSHGSTEYSVIFLANEMRILVAVDDLKTDMWDAPYLDWVTFRFDDLFSK